VPIEIGGISLNRIHKLTTLEQAALVEFRIPGLEGSVVQDLGRDSVRLHIEGIFYGSTAKDDLDGLRQLYTDRQPVDFLADIIGEAYFSQVMITRFDVFELAERPDEFSYVLHVMEYVPPPEPAAAPDLGDVDASILDAAQNFMDAVTLPDLIGSTPNITNPLEPLNGALDGVEQAMSGLSSVGDSLQSLFGVGGSG
jgi:hypothetical protein